VGVAESGGAAKLGAMAARRGEAGVRPGRVAAALLLGALAGCGGGSSNPVGALQAPCPRIAILGDGADLTRFRAGAERDLTAMVVDARVSGFEARCDFVGSDRRALDVRVTPGFDAERGPGSDGRVVDLRWFAALTDPGDTVVLDRQSFTTRVTFPINVQRASVTGGTARFSIPLSPGVRVADFTVRVSFQLTPEELALNRARGPR